MIQLYGIANCDSVKNARACLQARNQAHQFHDFKKLGVPADRLDAWLQALGWQVLLNRQGTTWRKLSSQQQAAVVDDATARAVMLAQPSIIKRPVLEWPSGRISVGAGGLAADGANRDAASDT
jgi:Spx/MgsR family transcriptional regulator